MQFHSLRSRKVMAGQGSSPWELFTRKTELASANERPSNLAASKRGARAEAERDSAARRAKVAPLSVRTASGSSFVSCPICQTQVPLVLVNEHIDAGCDQPQPLDTARPESLPEAGNQPCLAAKSSDPEQPLPDKCPHRPQPTPNFSAPEAIPPHPTDPNRKPSPPRKEAPPQLQHLPSTPLTPHPPIHTNATFTLLPMRDTTAEPDSAPSLHTHSSNHPLHSSQEASHEPVAYPSQTRPESKSISLPPAPQPSPVFSSSSPPQGSLAASPPAFPFLRVPDKNESCSSLQHPPSPNLPLSLSELPYSMDRTGAVSPRQLQVRSFSSGGLAEEGVKYSRGDLPSVGEKRPLQYSSVGGGAGEAAAMDVQQAKGTAEEEQEGEERMGKAQKEGGGSRELCVPTVFSVLRPLKERPKAPRGHIIFHDFISLEEEEAIIRCLDGDHRNPWKPSSFNGKYYGKAYGLVTDLRKRTTGWPDIPMPDFLSAVTSRMPELVPQLNNFVPNETNAIDYRKAEGAWIKPHVDDRQLSGNMIVNLSMGGVCYMTYARDRGPPAETFRVLLPRRSLQVQAGESRYSFTHAIFNTDLLDPRRVSLTFRQSKLPKHEQPQR